MARNELLYERQTESIIAAFYEVYNRLGYGFSEKAYSKALTIELRLRGHTVRREFIIDLYYRGIFIDRKRGDQLVDEKIIVEVKTAETMPKIAAKQCLSYLRASGHRVGLCLNFGPEPQVKRVISSGIPLGPDTGVVFPVECGPDPDGDLSDREPDPEPDSEHPALDSEHLESGRIPDDEKSDQI